MRVLDCGCGPGAMTVELAAAVAPGEAVGVDIHADQFDVGRTMASERGMTNVRFEQGTIYQLPFADESFDAVFVHAVLYHLREPLAALRQVWRVLRPGGVAGIRDSDTAGDLYAPADPTIDRAWALLDRLMRHNGGNPAFGRTQKAALRQAGFERISASASYDCYEAPAVQRTWGAFWADLLQREHAGLILEHGWATRDDLAAMARALRAWDEQPDAFFARARCEAVGWKE